MNKRFITLLLFCSLIKFSQLRAETDTSYTLTECYQHALKRSEIIANNIELIYQAEERIKQAKGNFFPTLSTNASYQKQEVPPPTSAIASDITPENQTNVNATASQNLFRGFRDFALMKERKHEKKASEALREQAKLQLFQDTSEAFYTILAYEHDIINYRSEIEAHEERRNELINLKKLARAREADVVSVDASIANLEASLEATNGELQSSRETLAFLTGLPAESPLNDSEIYPEVLTPVESWITHVDKRPDVIQLHEELIASEKKIDVSRSSYFPSLDAGANYYIKRPGIYDDINWDIFVSLSWQLFSGWTTESQVREAKSAQRGTRVQLRERKRQKEYEIRYLYKTLLNARTQVEKLANATELSQKRYELLLKDNRAGLATNIDVLQALAIAHQTKRTLDHAKLVAKLYYVKLETISAKKDLQQLEKDTSL